MLFSTYGPILDVNALKTGKMRGQAHVLFRDVQSATQAMRGCQGFEFFGREMVRQDRISLKDYEVLSLDSQKISYSKNRSDTLAKLTGTFNQPIAPTEQTKQIAPAPSSFPAPPGAAPPAPSGLPPPPGTLPVKLNGNAPPGLKAPEKEPEDMASPQGVKRQREDSDDEADDDDAPMQVDDDEDDEEAMEMSDSD